MRTRAASPFESGQRAINLPSGSSLCRGVKQPQLSGRAVKEVLIRPDGFTFRDAIKEKRMIARYLSAACVLLTMIGLLGFKLPEVAIVWAVLAIYFLLLSKEILK